MSVGVVWFRSDLRVVDNPAWDDATRRHSDVVALVVVDPFIISRAGSFRREAHAGYVRSLDESLGGLLTIRVGESHDEVCRVVEESGADALYFNGDVTAFARRRDVAVAGSVDRMGVEIGEHWGTLVHEPGAVTAATGRVSRVFSPFHRRWAAAPWTQWPDEGDAVVRRLDREELDAPREWSERFGSQAVDDRVDRAVERSEDYEALRNTPAVDGTTGLSTDLTFGAVSPRSLIEALGDGEGPGSLIRQLAWRDWYHHLFAEMPELATTPMATTRASIPWRDAPDEVDAWVAGRTGYPLVDAGMRQLAATGWMHNRVRMVTASFLVKDLLVEWTVGERYFRRILIDADIPQNAGNWQWVAGTGPDSAPFFRVLNPTTQSRRFDPNGTYIRRWVPELAGLDDRTIHDPSTASPLDLMASGVILGDTYPFPLVDHAEARQRALTAYRIHT